MGSRPPQATKTDRSHPARSFGSPSAGAKGSCTNPGRFAKRAGVVGQRGGPYAQSARESPGPICVGLPAGGAVIVVRTNDFRCLSASAPAVPGGRATRRQHLADPTARGFSAVGQSRSRRDRHHRNRPRRRRYRRGSRPGVLGRGDPAARPVLSGRTVKSRRRRRAPSAQAGYQLAEAVAATSSSSASAGSAALESSVAGGGRPSHFGKSKVPAMYSAM